MNLTKLMTFFHTKKKKSTIAPTHLLEENSMQFNMPDVFVAMCARVSLHINTHIKRGTACLPLSRN